MHFIHGRANAQYSDLQAIHHLANGQVETIQLLIKEENKMTGKPLSNLKFKKDILIAAIIRNGKTIFPTAKTLLKWEINWLSLPYYQISLRSTIC